MEKKKRWLFLSIFVAALGLVPLTLTSIITRGMTDDIVIGIWDTAARVTAAIAIIVYIKKVYKIRIGIRRENLIKGVFWHGLIILLFGAGVFVLNHKTPEKTFVEVLPILLFYAAVNVCIGLFEEVLCRGLLFNAFKAFWGDNKKGIYLSALISSFLFGAIHIGNLNGSNTITTITQVIYATFFGMIFAVIYYRTGNLLSCILLHGFVDYVDVFWRCFLNDRMDDQMIEETTDSTIGEALVILFLTSIFLISALVQLRMEFKDKEKKRARLQVGV